MRALGVAGVLPTTATSAALSTSSGDKLGFGASFIKVQSSAAEFGTIQGSDGLIGIGCIRHLHKREPTWLARISISHDIHLIHRSVRGEQLAQLVFGGTKL